MLGMSLSAGFTKGGSSANLVLIGSGAARLIAAGTLALARRRGIEFSSPLGSQK